MGNCNKGEDPPEGTKHLQAQEHQNQARLAQTQARLDACIRIIIKCDTILIFTHTINVLPSEQVLDSITVQLSERINGYRVIEAFLGEISLESQSSWEVQGVVDEAEVNVLLEEIQEVGLLVVDCNNNQIEILKVEEDQIVPVRSFGRAGNGPCEFKYPRDACIIDGNTIAVCDGDNNRIQILRMDGTYVRSIGQKGTGDGQLTAPYGVTTTPDGDLLICDTGNNRLQIMSISGVHVKTIGGKDQAPPVRTYPGGLDAVQFNRPRHAVVDNDGNIAVADCENNRIVRIDMDGKLLSEVGGLSQPYGVELDSVGNMLVASNQSNTVSVICPKGIEIWRSDAQFQNPRHVMQDHLGRVIVTDNHNVRVFSPVITTEIVAAWSCPRCTFENPGSSNTCEMCMHEREHENPANESASFKELLTFGGDRYKYPQRAIVFNLGNTSN